MIGLDVTHQTALTREKAHEWASLGTPAGDFLVTMTDYYIDFYLKNQPEIHGCGLHDPLAVAAALDPCWSRPSGSTCKSISRARSEAVPSAIFTAPGSRQTHPSRIGRQRAGIPRPFHDPRHRGRARVNDYASALLFSI